MADRIEAMCNENREYARKRKTNVKGFYLVPLKLPDAKVCYSCDNRVNEDGEVYCLTRLKYQSSLNDIAKKL